MKRQGPIKVPIWRKKYDLFVYHRHPTGQAKLVPRRDFVGISRSRQRPYKKKQAYKLPVLWYQSKLKVVNRIRSVCLKLILSQVYTTRGGCLCWYCVLVNYIRTEKLQTFFLKVPLLNILTLSSLSWQPNFRTKIMLPIVCLLLN